MNLIQRYHEDFGNDDERRAYSAKLWGQWHALNTCWHWLIGPGAGLAAASNDRFQAQGALRKRGWTLDTLREARAVFVANAPWPKPPQAAKASRRDILASSAVSLGGRFTFPPEIGRDWPVGPEIGLREASSRHPNIARYLPNLPMSEPEVLIPGGSAHTSADDWQGEDP